MKQHLLEMSLTQRILKLKDEKKIVKELNAILEEQGCKVEFFNLSLDRIKEGNQVLMLPCHSFQLSWQDTHRLLDYYDNNLADVFGKDLSITPDKDVVQFFNACKGDLYVDSFQALKATIEKSAFWSRTVLRPLGLAAIPITCQIVQVNYANLQPQEASVQSMVNVDDTALLTLLARDMIQNKKGEIHS
ncbi:hypothetical protein NYE24_19705 [Paenibacillus sp. FSL H7-0350]|uniref:hypothetical protein n=1 Tax=Paenibacillus sp. FSL H7-0350 TaxID=2975345 RepID=UPI0031580012